MAYTYTLYISTGFNTVNIPDSPALLNSNAFTHLTGDPLQILQNRDLVYIDVRVSSYAAIRDADYAKVDDWYYFVSGIQMLTADVARLTLLPDYLTSAGGPASLHILDGITSRVHVATDTYGEWTEDDPYTAPAHPLELVTERMGAGPTCITVVKSTLDLRSMGDGTAAKGGVTYTDATTQETVTVPKTVINPDSTIYELVDDDPQAVTNLSIGGESHTKLFNVQPTTIRQGIQEAGDLGLDGAITAQVVMPLGYVTPTYLNDQQGTGVITKMTGSNIIQVVPIPYEYNTPSGSGYSVKNKKTLYSNFTPYGIICSGGSKCEFMPYQIYEQGETNPHLRWVGDPRTDGKPYFRFKTLYGDDSLQGFFNSAVEGMPWKQVPLVYEGATGKAIAEMEHNQTLKRLAYETDQRTADITVAKNQALWGAAGSAIAGSIGSGIGGIASGNLASIGSIASEVIGFASSASNVSEGYDRQYANALKKYEIDRQAEFQKFQVATRVYNPTVSFPFSADLFRDLYGNGCIVYRYKYSTLDLIRVDKILTMYGYKVTKQVQISDFTNRTRFNYVEAGITVGNLPRWWADGISAQLSGGVRIWHVKPNNSYYNNNPIVS